MVGWTSIPWMWNCEYRGTTEGGGWNFRVYLWISDCAGGRSTPPLLALLKGQLHLFCEVSPGLKKIIYSSS